MEVDLKTDPLSCVIYRELVLHLPRLCMGTRTCAAGVTTHPKQAGQAPLGAPCVQSNAGSGWEIAKSLAGIGTELALGLPLSVPRRRVRVVTL